MSTCHDTFRNGLSTAVEDVSIPRHPIEELQMHRKQDEQAQRIREIGFQYGIAEAMRYQAQDRLLSQFHRLPGLKSSHLGLEVHRGSLHKIEMEDWLGDQDMDRRYFANFHATMEHKLGM